MFPDGHEVGPTMLGSSLALAAGWPFEGWSGVDCPEGNRPRWENGCCFAGENRSSRGAPVGLRREDEGGKTTKTAERARDCVPAQPLAPSRYLTKCRGWRIIRMVIIRHRIIWESTFVAREIRGSQGASEVTGQECVFPEGEHEPTSVAEVYRLVDVVSKKLTRLQRQQIGGAELTPAQYLVLRWLWQRDGRQFNELASACCCSPSTITGVVDTLEKKGLVTRQANPQDRRSLLVRLTDAGRALERATPDLEMIFEGCCGGLARDELGRLGELLSRLNDTIPDV